MTTSRPGRNLHRVFVYGAMRSGCHSHDTLKSALFMGVAHYPNGHSKMIDLGTAPGLIPDPDGATIRGELYGVGDALFKKLDEVANAVTDRFVRRKVTLWLGSPDEGTHVRAWCYFLKNSEGYKFRTPVVPFQPDDWYMEVCDWVTHRRVKAKHLTDLIKAGKAGDKVSEFWPHGGNSVSPNWSPTVYTGSANNYTTSTYKDPRKPDKGAKGYKGKYPEVYGLKDNQSVEVTTPSGRRVTFKRVGDTLVEVASVAATVKPEPALEGLSEDWIPPVEEVASFKGVPPKGYEDYEDYTIGEDYVMNMDTGKWEPREPLVKGKDPLTPLQKEIAATFLAAYAEANKLPKQREEEDPDAEESYCG